MNNKINFIPSVWGSSAWKFLHCVALSYPENPTAKQKNDYKNFFLSLDKILPCETCAKHFLENKKKHNINNYLSGPHKLFSWTVLIRNEVQLTLNRPLFDEKKLRNKLYNENEYANKSFKINPKIKLILFFTISILILYGLSKIFKIQIKKK